MRSDPSVRSSDRAEDVEYPDTLRVFEAWSSWEALAAHFITPHINRFRSRVGGLGVREFMLQKYRIDPGAPPRGSR